MKELKASIAKTLAYLKREHQMYSWELFKSLVVKALIQEGFTTIEAPVVEGEWLLAFTKKGEYTEINLWQMFK